MLMVMIYAFGHLSGAHFNPAVTLAIWMRKKISNEDAVAYVIAQTAGSLLAFLVVWLVVEDTVSIRPPSGISEFDAMLVELLLTFALVTVVLNVATHSRTAGNHFYGIAIGFTVMAGAFAFGTISSAVFNPAVALGGQLVDLLNGGDSWEAIWVYIAPQLAAGGLAAALYAYMYPEQ
jgi:aquaporin Z